MKNRVPTVRASRVKVTPAALAAFCALVAAERAGALDEWWVIQGNLHRALGLKPWQWPAVPFPHGGQWVHDGQWAFDLRAKLEAAL